MLYCGLMKRIYETVLAEHFAELRQMAFLSGPRQVGKTTLAKVALPGGHYLSYDKSSDAALILRGAEAVAGELGLSSHEARPEQGAVLFDEIHKFPRWKQFLKGFFDVYGDNRKLKIAVTGSARLDIYKRGGDSMMGRYFPYRIHPLSAGEVVSSKVNVESMFQEAKDISQETIDTLLELGGYPEAFLNGTDRFHRRWQKLRLELIFSQDLRDLSRVQDVYQVQRLAELLAARVSGGVNYASLAEDLSVSPPAVKNWLVLLQSVFYCYEVRPWSKNVASSIRKQPKIYLWDWSEVRDAGARRENFIASHLLKAVHFWTDAGLGNFGLHYLRDKMQREVDFLVSKDGKPFMLVECKSSGKEPLSSALVYFKKTLEVPLAWQVCFDMPQSGLDPTDAGLSPSRIAVADLLRVLV